MKKFIFETIRVLVLLSIASLSLSLAQAWTGPTATPPGNNVSAPVNASDVTQEKGGIFGAHGFFNLGTAWFSTSTRASWPPANLTLAVNGPVGATAYCDDTGTNCTTAAQINAVASTSSSYSLNLKPIYFRFGGYSKSSSATWSAGNPTIGQITFTKAELKSNILQLSSVSDDNIAGLIVQYSASPTCASSACERAYKLEAYGSVPGGSAIYTIRQSSSLYMYYSGGSSYGITSNNIVIIPNGGSFNSFSLNWSLWRIDGIANPPAPMTIDVSAYIVGYLTNI